MQMQVGLHNADRFVSARMSIKHGLIWHCRHQEEKKEPEDISVNVS